MKDSHDIDVKTFAANLRAEMGKQDITLQGLLRKLDAMRDALEQRSPADIEPPFSQLWFHRCYELLWPGNSARPVTTEEVEVIATALGCPVERLTVSREELEANLKDALKNILTIQTTAIQFRLETYDLTAEVERISAERDHYREENVRLREVLVGIKTAFEYEFPEDVVSEVAKAMRAYEAAQ